MELKGKRLKSGSAGVVYDIGDDTCYKKIYNHEYVNNQDCLDILKTIKNLKLYNFCRLMEIKDKDGDIVGYTMQHIYEEDLDILTLPKDYILDSYVNLYMSMDILADNGIYANDFGFHNTFITSSGIIAYDYDLYIKCDKYSAKVRNRAKLNAMFNELLCHEIETHYKNISPSIVTSKVNELFNAQTNPQLLEQALNGYNRLLDYVEDTYAKVH